MTSTADSSPSQSAASLPLNPFVSNRYHYGMLLGVDDLQAEQGYHRGKAWLHNAWLHGGGAIWGLRVEPGHDNELVVRRGLALDHHGRELWLAADECIDIGRWFDALDNEKTEVVQSSDTSGELIAHVRLCADQCLDRPVPSITEPCGDSDAETTHSRTVERARLELVAGEPKSPTQLYPGLRALIDGTVESESEVEGGADGSTESKGDCGPDGTTPVPPSVGGQETGEKDAGGQDTTGQDAEDCPSPESDSCPDRWHRVAVTDTMKLSPADPHKPWSPFDGDGCITLARLKIPLVKSGDEWMVDGQPMVDNSVRPVHLATRSLQSLIWQALCCCEDDVETDGSEYAAGAEPARHGAQPTATAALTDTSDGFRVDGQSVEVEGRTIVIPFTGPVDRGSVKTAGFAVATLESDGWSKVEVKNAGPDDAGLSATLTLDRSVDVSRLRVVVRGTGEQPIMSRDFEPLLGCVGDPPSASAGYDAVVVRDLSSPGTNTGRGSS